MEEDTEIELTEEMREEAKEALLAIGLTEDEAEREAEDYYGQ